MSSRTPFREAEGTPPPKKAKSSTEDPIMEVPLRYVCDLGLVKLVTADDCKLSLRWDMEPLPHFKIIWKLEEESYDYATIMAYEIDHIWIPTAQHHLPTAKKVGLFLLVQGFEEDFDEILTARRHIFTREYKYLYLAIDEEKPADAIVWLKLMECLTAAPISHALVPMESLASRIKAAENFTTLLTRNKALSGMSRQTIQIQRLTKKWERTKFEAVQKVKAEHEKEMGELVNRLNAKKDEEMQILKATYEANMTKIHQEKELQAEQYREQMMFELYTKIASLKDDHQKRIETLQNELSEVKEGYEREMILLKREVDNTKIKLSTSKRHCKRKTANTSKN